MNYQAQAGLLETLYGFGLDAIQKTKELKRMLTNYRAPPESITNNTRDTLCFWTFFRAKDQEN